MLPMLRVARLRKQTPGVGVVPISDRERAALTNCDAIGYSHVAIAAPLPVR